ncbi:hypothetical protein GPECTOR_7g1181 [Gonium pectorale]|uniref:Uncharacterized protein n=1 Tax=Gonium pectorale TaxID=33097 RepID=A0A150GTU8_GONPE|nr:hypothetical protein GPECTOR_7g1181 [Gonium pectorale]|eukprot:KXZ53287.1 hypothetical protein GPECTOR_7g1181 [Gonium pectorale]
MAMLTAVTMLAAVAALLGTSSAQPNTKGQRFEGFTYASNVIGYVNMTMDFCEIKAAIEAGDWATATTIYSTGKNSMSGLSRRSFSRFASFAYSAEEPTHAALLMGRNATYLDTVIREALANKNGALVLGLLQFTGMKYGIHEIDEAATKIAQYVANATAENAALISDDAGAPHSVDEAWALWSSGSAMSCGSMSAWARTLGADMGTTFLGRSHINNGMTLVYNELLATSRSADLPAYIAARTSLTRHLIMLGLQGVSHSVFKAQHAARCKQAAAEAEAKAMIAVHWTYLEPLLVYRNTPAANIDMLEMALTAPQADYAKALPAIKAVVHKMGRRMAEIGTPDAKRITAGWNC